MSLHSAPTPFSSTRATRAGALRAHGLGVIFLRAGRYAACFQGRDAAHELTWDLCGKSHLFQPGSLAKVFVHLPLGAWCPSPFRRPSRVGSSESRSGDEIQYLYTIYCTVRQKRHLVGTV